MVGPLVRINGGGSPGKGTGIAIKQPLQPGMADADKAGDLLEQIWANEPTETKKHSRTTRSRSDLRRIA